MSLPGCSNTRGRWDWRSQSKQCSWAWHRVTGCEDRGIWWRVTLGSQGQGPVEDWPSFPGDTILWPLETDGLAVLALFSPLCSLYSSPLSFSFSFLFFFFPLSFSLCLLSVSTVLRYPTVSRVTQPKRQQCKFLFPSSSFIHILFKPLMPDYNSCFKSLSLIPITSPLYVIFSWGCLYFSCSSYVK